MTVVTCSVHLVTGVFKFLPIGSHLLQFLAVALGKDRVASIAIIGFDDSFGVRTLMKAVVAAETTRPVFVPDVIGIGFPTGVHFREEIIFIDLLNHPDDR